MLLSMFSSKKLSELKDFLNIFRREDSVSMSPSYCHSDNDDNNSDNVETSERYNSASPSATGTGSFGAQRSPASSKRYRTHLTPLQVHVGNAISSRILIFFHRSSRYHQIYSSAFVSCLVPHLVSIPFSTVELKKADTATATDIK